MHDKLIVPSLTEFLNKKFKKKSTLDFKNLYTQAPLKKNQKYTNNKL